MADPKIHLTIQQMENMIRASKLEKMPSAFDKVLLHGLKIPADAVKTFGRMFEIAQTILGFVSTVGLAISTVKSLLTSIGILKEDDPFAEIKELFEARFQELKEYYDKEEQEQQTNLRIGWQVQIAEARTAASNLNARTDATLASATKALSGLAGALTDMLQPAPLRTATGLALVETIPARGWITFAPEAYSYPLLPQGSPVPEHWINYARPEFMSLVASAQPVQFSTKSDTLRQRLWDPSFYLDVLIEGLSVYVTLLTAIEPAFRATRYERQRILDMADGLSYFTETWKARLIRTKIDPFLQRGLGENEAYPYNPYQNNFYPIIKWGIPLGVIDPVSGFAAFDPLFNRDFTLNDPPLGIATNDRFITNADEAKKTANSTLDELIKAMPAVCGIKALEETTKQFAELADYGLYGSQFTKFSPLPFDAFVALREFHALPVLLGEEKLSLGDLGVKAGMPGKFYRALRYKNESSQFYRVSMARRMDITKIQLGYRLKIEMAGAPPRWITLCPHDEPSSVFEPNLKIFPEGEHKKDISADNALIYDVVQPGLLSKADEGKLDLNKPIPGFQRLYINRRTGKAQVTIKVWLSFDTHDDDAPVVGHANIMISGMGASEGAFNLTFTIFETAAIRYGSYIKEFATDKVQEIQGDSLELTISPTYLVAESEYFSDRLKGIMVFDKSIADVAKVLNQAPKPWDHDFQPPNWKFNDVAFHQERIITRYKQLEAKHPELIEAATALHQLPGFNDRVLD
ncbi:MULTISPECIES: hypothetical protein [unclassified Lysobacter]|uniref:hypothetical protein n=1 Tax=unclassified Lysobacter TaxID=2635362 RepID=UPI001BED1EE2|nr:MULTISPECIES: hypothetical protein [unclassified Lysobacter]MBT2746836.1 hypothetical protein [Lysobacter sp. ISL-42]MBT2750679.1 hypothetical protein [Lysobacter sp. ISL-50]MBT2779508.1 hypothetical protein [Lysobacter sp. ISL-54]MBT2784652.1 hypothetical protein [Lysobacter sp. ISL-52]